MISIAMLVVQRNFAKSAITVDALEGLAAKFVHEVYHDLVTVDLELGGKVGAANVTRVPLVADSVDVVFIGVLVVSLRP